MIEVSAATRDDLLVIKGSGKLTTEDYEKVFIPRMEAMLREYGRIKVAFCFGQDFHGWELGAMWDDASFGVKHCRDFNRVAVIGAPKWVEWGTRLCAHLMPGQVRVFAAGEYDAAMAWLAEED